MINWRNSRFVFRSGFFLAILVLFLAGAGRANAQANGCAGVPNDPKGAVIWNPNWCQEFNSPVPGSPDTAVWNFDLGNSGFGNNEIEIYCGPPGTQGNLSSCPSTFSTSTSNAYVDGGGHLVIQAINNNGIWTSSRMKTQFMQDFQFGRIEASIQLPDTTHQGLWPAFWTLGSNITTVPWPGCGEADIMEVWSPAVFNGAGPGGNRSTVHTALTDGAGVQPNGSFSFPSPARNDTTFHKYGMLWSANMMQYYVDDPTKPFYIVTSSDLKQGDTWPFNLKLFLLLNLAVGGTLGGTPDASTPNPGTMMVDYVRQYLPSPLAKPVLGNPSPISIKAGAATGNSSTFAPGIAPNSGFVYFSCGTSAPKASCSITTNDSRNTHVIDSSVVPTENLTVTVPTTANSMLPPFFFGPWLPSRLLTTIAAFLLLLFLALALRTQSRVWRHVCATAAVLILVGIAIAGCGGNSVTPILPGNNGTPPGSYVVTVYAFTETNTSDGTNANANANVAIPLTVN
jgi:beta-glucanase (GH16 family)